MFKAALCIIFLAVVTGSCNNGNSNRAGVNDTARVTDLAKQKWHWNNSSKQDTSAGYAQAVKVNNTIYISGIPTSDLSPKGIEQLYTDLGKTLAAYGCNFGHVVKENLYTTDIEAMKLHNEARKKFYTNDYPAATWVQVARLYEPSAKLEVDLIAIKPE